MLRFTRPFSFIILMLALFSATLLSGCSAASAAAGDHNRLAMAPLSEMPAEVRNAPSVVKQAYQFAVANPDAAKQIPCYCGCGSMGHTSSYSCYVQDVQADGTILYDTHALGCSICVDITLDTMRLMNQGKSMPEIKSYVDAAYSPFGPSNMP